MFLDLTSELANALQVFFASILPFYRLNLGRFSPKQMIALLTIYESTYVLLITKKNYIGIES